MPVVKGDIGLPAGTEAKPSLNSLGKVHNAQKRTLDLIQTQKSVFPFRGFHETTKEDGRGTEVRRTDKSVT